MLPVGNISEMASQISSISACVDTCDLSVRTLYNIIMVITILVSTSKSQNQMNGGLFLDVVIRDQPTVLQLFSSEDELLLIWRNSFSFLN